MRRYATISVGMIAAFLALFGIARMLDLQVLDDPGPWMARGGGVAAGVGLALLVADVLLPVPSSVVMVAHGAFFGVLGGAALSLVGSVGAAIVAFGLGRRGGIWLERLVTPADRARADAFLSRWGATAVAASRPVPLVAETVAILAGTTTMSWRALVLGAIGGNLPPALLYAATGATAASLGETWMVFGLVLAVAGGFWWWAWRAAREPVDA